ncbi:uncharacterized protein YoxC [Paenibacillus anaericanus]|uniref:DUF948 domain-containing protein n=1 Tax=Paenibacillus anaericanus TaxID=170367 RepID=UPI0027816263|nr:DUF948 domain-containing protein [Paenibacillus anaericanus]MDQ0091274.1 uncharacterized protein YoxC [Paenibacillus anaericanus]
MIWELSLALIAVAFVALVIFLIKTLVAAEKSLDKTTQTLQDVQKTIDELSYEVKQVVRQVNDITGDVQHKMKQIDPVLESVKNVGEVLSEVTLATKQVSTSVIEKFKKPSKRTASNHAPVPVVAAQIPNNPTTPNEVPSLPKSDPAKKQPDWIKVVDVAAVIWQKYRA